MCLCGLLIQGWSSTQPPLRRGLPLGSGEASLLGGSCKGASCSPDGGPVTLPCCPMMPRGRGRAQAQILGPQGWGALGCPDPQVCLCRLRTHLPYRVL